MGHDTNILASLFLSCCKHHTFLFFSTRNHRKCFSCTHHVWLATSVFFVLCTNEKSQIRALRPYSVYVISSLSFEQSNENNNTTNQTHTGTLFLFVLLPFCTIVGTCVCVFMYQISAGERTYSTKIKHYYRYSCCVQKYDRSVERGVERLFFFFLFIYSTTLATSRFFRLLCWIDSGLLLRSLLLAVKKNFCHLHKGFLDIFPRLCTRLKKLNI